MSMMKTIAAVVIAGVASAMLTSGVVANATEDTNIAKTSEEEVVLMSEIDAVDSVYDEIITVEGAETEGVDEVDEETVVTVELDGKVYENCVMTVDELDDTRYICDGVKILVHRNDVVLYDGTNGDEPAVYNISDLIVR